MAIQTILANISCSSLAVSLPWYEKLFGSPATRRPMDGLAEWHFTDSAEVQLYEQKANAGKSTLTLGVLPLQSELRRLIDVGLPPGAVEETKDFFLSRLTDPDGNLIVLISSSRA